MNKRIIISMLISFIIGLIVGIGLFYNEDWNGFRRHLEWNRALRDFNIGGDSSLRQCLYYWKPTSKTSASGYEIFCIQIKGK